MKRPIVFVASALLGLLVCVPLSAQDKPLSTDEQILRELQSIRQLLERMAGPAGPSAGAPTDPSVRLQSLIGPTLGKPGALVTIVEFTDLQCPFCRQFTATAFQEIKKTYIDTGLVRFVTKDFPIEELHPFAMKAARASRCAGEEGKAWEMRHAILARNDQLSDALIQTIATELSLTPARFTQCMASPKYDASIRKDLADGTAIGVTGTPSFVIGRTPGAGALDGTLFVGARPFEHFDVLLKTLLTPSEKQ